MINYAEHNNKLLLSIRNKNQEKDTWFIVCIFYSITMSLPKSWMSSLILSTDYLKSRICKGIEQFVITKLYFMRSYSGSFMLLFWSIYFFLFLLSASFASIKKVSSNYSYCVNYFTNNRNEITFMMNNGYISNLSCFNFEIEYNQWFYNTTYIVLNYLLDYVKTINSNRYLDLNINEKLKLYFCSAINRFNLKIITLY